MSHLRRVALLGYQPIPRFADRATLNMSGQCFSESFAFPEVEGIHNVACLAFFPRQQIVRSAPPISITFWSQTHAVGIDNTYGNDEVKVPQGAEYFAVAWATPPVNMLASTAVPNPEDFFRLTFKLRL